MRLTGKRSQLARAIRTAGDEKAWAAVNGMSTAYVSDVRLGRREPGAKVLDTLDLERIVSYPGKT